MKTTISVAITDLSSADWGRCDYCGKQQLCCLKVTSAEGDDKAAPEALACRSCADAVREVPLPVVIWAREHDIESVRWQELQAPRPALGEDAFIVGDVMVKPIGGPEKRGHRCYAGVSDDPFQEHHVVYWF